MLRNFKAVVQEWLSPSDSEGCSYGHCMLVNAERLLTESEPNLCKPSKSLVLLATFVWTMSECDALLIVLMN